MKLINFLILFLLLMLMIAIQDINAWEWHYSKETGVLNNIMESMVRGGGHYNLLRESVSEVNKILYNEGRKFRYESLPKSRKDAHDPLTRGNEGTDFPDDNQCLWESSLKKYYHEESEDWDYNPRLQMVHFLRNYKNEGLVFAYDSCTDAKLKIKNATIEAVKQWQAGRRKTAIFL